MIPTREDAWALLTEFTQNESLIKHALAVEAAMRAYAIHFHEDPEQWGLVGLIHDFDYEKYPTAPEHCTQGARILRERGWPEWVIRAVLSHANYTGVSRESRLEKALFAVDELCGFVIAVALVRPDRKIASVEASSVRKKMKDKAFARAVNREDIMQGAAGLGVNLDENITLVIHALSGIADRLGL